jgi:hypothetical protein
MTAHNFGVITGKVDFLYTMRYPAAPKLMPTALI